jgi:hypothetical protein
MHSIPDWLLVSTEQTYNEQMFCHCLPPNETRSVNFFTFSLQESDLLSAILLEQAAHCFLRTRPQRIRKYAFNMILAGHRYSKAAQVWKQRMCWDYITRSLIGNPVKTFGEASAIWGFGVVWASAFHLWDREFDSRYGLMTPIWKESVNALPKVVGFLRVLRFPPTGNVDRVHGLGLSP